MTPSVSPIAAWVFAHGATAEEIVFRDVESEGELPGISTDERAAMDALIPELRAIWLGVLKAARETVWALSATSPCNAALRRSVNRDETIWSRGYVAMSAGTGLSVGVSLDPWGEDQYHLFVWLWVAPERQAEVEDALRDHQPTPWRNEHRSFLLTLDAPREGEPWQAAGQRAGEALWGMLRAVVGRETA
jgi:hypothetical protein